MLRSTGFFRGIDCPFYAEYCEGKSSRNGCNRPYCHFRHSQQRRLSYGAPADIKKLNSTQKEQGYDPFNPEVVRPQEQQNGKQSASGDISGALELVNKAIEEVRSQVEREKRKLSRIGDEPYDPSGSTSLSSSDAVKIQATTAATHLAYDPGSYQMTSGGYNPTPGCSKYTLDSDTQGNSSNSMEYVPTSLKKPPSRTHQVPSPPQYSNSTSSSKCKYTVDNSRPSTDMEYDPLSNYSAGIAGKSKRDESAQAFTVEGSKTQRLPDEELVKKSQQQSVDTKKYTISDSDGESSGTEYRPTSLSNLQQRKGHSGSAGDTVGKERTEGLLIALAQRSKDDSAQDLDVQQEFKLKKNIEKKKEVSRSGHEKSAKSERVNKLEKKTGKTSSIRSSGSSKDKEHVKNSNLDSVKKENKSHEKRDNKKNLKMKTSDKVHREDKRSEGKPKAVEKVKTNPRKRERDKDTEDEGKVIKKPRISEKEKEPSKHKELQHKNGKIDCSKREKEVKKLSKSSSSTSSSNSKDKVKHSISSSNGKRLEEKRRILSLSHADLFGDESAEEAEPMEVDDDDEEVLVRKSADALKRGRLNKRKASELIPSSSEDEADHRDVEGSREDKDEVASIGIDFSSFQDDLDFDSDPMEECLRIFNESKDVKKEDKGRQAKQCCRDSEEDKSTEGTLTTLFPGQKKRVSHFVAKGNTDAPSKNVVRPYRRPTAQEVCYQRMQMAQQQAAQLSASVTAASQSSASPSSSGERKRIAHRPNPLVSPSKTSFADAKPAGNQVSPSQSVKAQTTAGILSKTVSTVSQKRVAHTPTLKSTSMKRPVIPTEFGAKVPTNIRQRYLNTFIDECLKFCSSEEAAFQMALEEEKQVYDRSNRKNIYLNVAVNTLKKLRSRSSSSSVAPVNKKTGLVTNRKAQSHEQVLGGRLAATTSFTVNRMGKQQEEKLIGATLYRKLKPYLLTEEQLQQLGYPRVNPEAPGKAIFYNASMNNVKKANTDSFNKICCRCGAEYKITANGNCLRKEECSFHWGRIRTYKVAGGWETNYSCCSAAVGSPGCQVVKQHIHDGRKESLDGYVSTFSKTLPPDGNAGMFALDCEMCYTKVGLELTRVTVIDSDLNVIYDTFVKPENQVVDYNTRFSGVTEEDLENVSITLRDVQAVLLNMFSAESILVGHSLESDLMALKLIHSSVVDTAVVFPHRHGLPYKRALRHLMADYLKRIIQDSVDGHDSSEDASACMELIIWKIKEDAKVKR
ncbi:RNA exonuclease 1 homolog [Aulostomus maculatus]